MMNRQKRSIVFLGLRVDYNQDECLLLIAHRCRNTPRQSRVFDSSGNAGRDGTAKRGGWVGGRESIDHLLCPVLNENAAVG